MLLEKKDLLDDIKKMNSDELTLLSNEIREVIIKKLSKKGGHLASNLGIIELTVALHHVFESPKDKMVFDVSHQCYTHKILTGRKEAFMYEENYDDVSGYSNPDESEHDFFNIGHTSTSISLACGIAKARDLQGGKENIIAIIGDASLDGGMAFEALNYAKELNSGLIVVVNDNDMSIPENHGALCDLLTELRESNGKAKNNYFEALGFEYIFVKDGHDIGSLVEAFSRVKDTKSPVVVHCCTQKGKGYSFAEKNREKWHWAHPFDIESGEFKSYVPKENYGALACEFLLEKIKKDKNVVVMAASTPLCIGFNAEKRKMAGNQFVDVGIAEQHAISMAAGLAKRGGKPVFATNSTFYQRAYDQIEQEMCISKCAATMIVTHAGLYGHTNDTHAGLYDITLLANIPNLVYLAPTNKQEYLAMLEWAIEQQKEPVAIRVPWNGVHYATNDVTLDYSHTKYKINQHGEKIAIIALGSFYQLGETVAKEMYSDIGIHPTLINPQFITGIDAELLDDLMDIHSIVITLEDGILNGGFGAKIAQYYSMTDMKVLNCGFSLEIPNRYVPQELLEKNGLTPEQIVAKVKKLI